MSCRIIIASRGDGRASFLRVRYGEPRHADFHVFFIAKNSPALFREITVKSLEFHQLIDVRTLDPLHHAAVPSGRLPGRSSQQVALCSAADMSVFIIFHRGGGAGGGGRGNAIFFRPLGCVIIYMAPRGRMLNFGQQLCHLHSSIVAEL